jgi:protease I
MWNAFSKRSEQDRKQGLPRFGRYHRQEDRTSGILKSLCPYSAAMKKIAALITDMFEDVEFNRPAEAFTAAGHLVVTVGLKRGEIVTGKAAGTRVTIEAAVKDVSVKDFDALFIPGGYSPDKLRAHPGPVAFVREFVESGKPVLGICHAAQLLITAQVIRGRRITGYVSIIQDIKNAGALFVDEPVVEDGNLLFSRDPRDIPAFIEAALKKLEN